jgi:hypothetical protein
MGMAFFKGSQASQLQKLTVVTGEKAQARQIFSKLFRYLLAVIR